MDCNHYSGWQNAWQESTVICHKGFTGRQNENGFARHPPAWLRSDRERASRTESESADAAGNKTPPHESGGVGHATLFDGLECFVEFLKMRLRIGGLGEAGKLAERQTADQLHLGVLDGSGCELLQYFTGTGVLQDLFDLEIERKCLS